MPYKDPELRRRRDHERYLRNYDKCREQVRLWKLANPDRRYRHRQRPKTQHDKDLSKKLRNWQIGLIKLIKETTPCEDCKRYYPAPVMEFDHVRGTKLFDISAAPTHRCSLDRLRAEIEKCDLVCANCHRIRHIHRPSYHSNHK
jgi:hypothetical protein